MGSASSKTKSSKISPFIQQTNKRASKRILKRNSVVYPTQADQHCNNDINENNNNISNSIQNTRNDEVVLRNTHKNENSSESLPICSSKSTKKEKKKKKSEIDEDSISTYHQTNVCYYKVDNGKFLKLPNDTKHKSNDGCYVKLSNGSFRQ
jgi:hypothetical protein